jgi:hypothetical protein
MSEEKCVGVARTSASSVTTAGIASNQVLQTNPKNSHNVQVNYSWVISTGYDDTKFAIKGCICDRE